jgi:hypothetical protein
VGEILEDELGDEVLVLNLREGTNDDKDFRKDRDETTWKI